MMHGGTMKIVLFVFIDEQYTVYTGTYVFENILAWRWPA